MEKKFNGWNDNKTPIHGVGGQPGPLQPANSNQPEEKRSEVAEASKPQIDMIPPHAIRELKKLAEITGNNIDALIAGYWYRFGEVQTLQIELDYRNKIIESLEEGDQEKGNVASFRNAAKILEKERNQLKEERDEWKAKYEKCINAIKRFDAGIIGLYDL